MPSKKSGQHSEKQLAKEYAKELEETYLKKVNGRLALSFLIKSKKSYFHIEQYRDYLINHAAKGKREIVNQKEKANLGDLYVDKKGKLECFLGYKWLTISDINNKDFTPDKEILEKLENFKTSKLFKTKKYRLPKYIVEILKEKASKINTLLDNKKNERDKFIDQTICIKLKTAFQHAQIKFIEKYDYELQNLSDDPKDRRVFGTKMKSFCLAEVDSLCKELELNISKIKKTNSTFSESTNLVVSEKYKPKLPQIENKNYTKTESAFLFKYISPQGYYAWHKLAKAYIEKSRSYSSTKLFQVFSAPAYYVTKELLNAFLNTPVSKLKLESRPEIINNQFFLLQSLDINEIAYSYIDASATKQQRNDLTYDIVIKSYLNIDKNECRFNRKTGITLPKYKNRTKLNSIKFNWSDLNRITTCKGVLPFDDLTTVEKEQFMIVVNLILFMNQEPDISVQYVSPSVITRPQKNSIEKDTFKPRDITWIGKEFTQRTLKVATNNEIDIIKEGSRPMRSHWRRGHWHTVLQGIKRQQRKMKWYQPIFVKGNKL